MRGVDFGKILAGFYQKIHLKKFGIMGV